tara:strand:+ start:1836 stop:2813 length:978 start_codon:yes stop_codon:yes gene_type:complete
MRYSEFSVNNIHLSVIGFPLWTLATGGWGKKDPDLSIYLLQQAFEKGINFFDTADSYGKGYGEELLRESLSPVRHEIVISTKFGYDFYSPKLDIEGDGKNFDPKYVSYACEQSLRRIGTDYLDMYFVHYPSYAEVENDDLYETLEKLVDAGKILNFGIATDDRPEAAEIANLLAFEREVDLFHTPFSLLEQDLVASFDQMDKNISIIARRVHSFGLLEESYDPKIFEDLDSGTQKDNSVFRKMLEMRPNYDFLFDQFEESVSDVALRFAINNRNVASTLPNISDIENLGRYCLYADRPDLDTELMSSINEVYSDQKENESEGEDG